MNSEFIYDIDLILNTRYTDDYFNISISPGWQIILSTTKPWSATNRNDYDLINNISSSTEPKKVLISKGIYKTIKVIKINSDTGLPENDKIVGYITTDTSKKYPIKQGCYNVSDIIQSNVLSSLQIDMNPGWSLSISYDKITNSGNFSATYNSSLFVEGTETTPLYAKLPISNQRVGNTYIPVQYQSICIQKLKPGKIRTIISQEDKYFYDNGVYYIGIGKYNLSSILRILPYPKPSGLFIIAKDIVNASLSKNLIDNYISDRALNLLKGANTIDNSALYYYKSIELK